jgi:hypothetical protein
MVMEQAHLGACCLKTILVGLCRGVCFALRSISEADTSLGALLVTR